MEKLSNKTLLNKHFQRVLYKQAYSLFTFITITLMGVNEYRDENETKLC